MAHLREAEFVDYLDGTLGHARAVHVDGCEACRTRAASLRAAIVRTAGDPVPEPSPLFWEHFSQRIRQAVSEGPPPAARAPTSWFRRPAFSVATIAAAAVISVALVFWSRADNPTIPTQRTLVPVEPAVAVTSEEPRLDLDADEEWALVRVAAEDLEWDQAPAAGLIARPGTADRIALEMSPAERQELSQLIEDEMKRTGA